MRRSFAVRPGRRSSGPGALALAAGLAWACSQPRSSPLQPERAELGDAAIPQRPAPPPIVPGGLDADTEMPDLATEIRDGTVDQIPGPAPDLAPAPPSDGGSRPSDLAEAADPTPPPDVPAAEAARPPDAAPDRPTIELPPGCPIVSCDGVAGRRDCCRAWYYFGLDANQMQRDGLVTKFHKGADVSASYAFDRAGQVGAVGMLIPPRRLAAIRIVSSFGGPAAHPPYVSTEAAGGTSGCGYPLRPTGDVDLARPLFCWGDRGFVPDRINVRVESRAAGAASIRITALTVR